MKTEKDRQIIKNKNFYKDLKNMFSEHNMTQCRKSPFALNSKRIAKSPMKTLVLVLSTEKKFRKGQSIGFTYVSSLKSMGRIPRSDGCYTLGTKYQ